MLVPGLPVKSPGAPPPVAVRPPARGPIRFAQHENPAASFLERIAVAEILIAAIALDAKRHVHPAVGTDGQGAAVVTATAGQARQQLHRLPPDAALSRPARREGPP